jgi:hypothetical protein
MKTQQYKAGLNKKGIESLKAQLLAQGWEPDLEDWDDEIRTMIDSEELETTGYCETGRSVKLRIDMSDIEMKDCYKVVVSEETERLSKEYSLFELFKDEN